MRILHAIRSVNPAGGGPIESIVQADRILQTMGHSSRILCLDPPTAPWLASCPVPATTVGPAWTLYHYTPRWTTWLRKQAREYDAVIVHGVWRYPSLGTWLARDTGVPYFLYTHGMLDPTLRDVFAVKHFGKSIAWKAWEHRVVRDAAAVLFTCEEERRLARESYKPYACREAIVPYCVGEPPPDADAQRKAFWTAFPQLCGKRLILFLSRLHPKKGCDVLIEAFARVASSAPDMCLIMAGPDSIGWRAKLELFAEKLQVASRITWTGMLSGDLKWGAFRCAELFVLPSHQENFGIAVVEALACGVPVLITRRVNIWRELETDGAAITADAPDAGAVAQLLSEWGRMPRAEQEHRRSAARACFETRFRSDVAAKLLLETLRSCGVRDEVNRHGRA